MIGPPFRKLSTKKFLSNALSGTAGLAATVGEALVVVVAGDIAAVAGVMPAAGEIAAATGLVIVAGAVGGVPARLAGGAPGGGVWPKELNMSVTEQKMAISSVFIGLIGEFFPGSNSDENVQSVYPQRGKGESSKTFAFVFSAFGSWRTTNVSSHRPIIWDV
jgi:hypothetical protein